MKADLKETSICLTLALGRKGSLIHPPCCTTRASVQCSKQTRRTSQGMQQLGDVCHSRSAMKRPRWAVHAPCGNCLPPKVLTQRLRSTEGQHTEGAGDVTRTRARATRRTRRSHRELAESSLKMASIMSRMACTMQELTPLFVFKALNRSTSHGPRARTPLVAHKSANVFPRWSRSLVTPCRMSHLLV
eukprot:15463101-Alexandrium_andersonii.AAC.1